MSDNREDIHRVLEQKLKACEDFLTVTWRLKEALANDEDKAVQELITRREKLIRLIDGLDRQIDRHRETGFFNRDSANFSKLRKYSEEIRNVLHMAIAADEDCDSLTAEKCKELKSTMIRNRQKKTGIQGYGYVRKTEQAPKFLNVRT